MKKKTVALATLLVVVAAGCASETADNDPRDDSDQSDAPAATQRTQQAEQAVVVDVDRVCNDFMIWCQALGKCIATDQVCYDPNKSWIRYE
jgi:PBP1b-binding outer membrane lipoprotein LpoB